MAVVPVSVSRRGRRSPRRRLLPARGPLARGHWAMAIVLSGRTAVGRSRMSGHAFSYVGGMALGLLAYALFLFVGGLAVRPLRRLRWLDRLLPPRWPGCIAAGAAWVVAALWFSRTLVGTLVIPFISPGVVAAAAPLEARGVDTLAYGTQILVVGLALDAAGYSLICYALCKFVQPRRRAGPAAGSDPPGNSAQRPGQEGVSRR